MTAKIVEVVAREYCLTKPFTFVERTRIIDSIPDYHLLLKPIVAGICGSEMLYFKGQKELEKLAKRLPMCLLHEGVAEVVKTGAGTTILPKTRVVVNPLVPCGKCFACMNLQENLCYEAKYMAANVDGLARTFFLYPESRVIPVPEDIELEVAALSEPISVALNAVEASGIKEGEKVAVIGDGAIGFLVASVVSSMVRIPHENLFFIGVVDGKLSMARDFATILNSYKEKQRLEELFGKIDVVFEAAGGGAHKSTVSQSIRLLRLGGRCILLGISSGEVSVAITNIVNKNLMFRGITRSKMEHFVKVLDLLRNNESFRSKVKRAISDKNFVIRSAKDLEDAFRYADTEAGEAHLNPGRVLVKFP
ncbi:alcohol dehydrogenase catalytic domain-containing protein [Candidatus Bathyarchaeota archaeon]|nr:alcohol dehydrogenase catalytic domain-containing protein [Candidatus Bathyarchaeota archaeon]